MALIQELTTTENFSRAEKMEGYFQHREHVGKGGSKVHAWHFKKRRKIQFTCSLNLCVCQMMRGKAGQVKLG
jgi:hypothetical protein